METIKLWEPLLSLVDSSSSEIATQALWVAGTAIQNNPKSQVAVSHSEHSGNHAHSLVDLVLIS